MLSYWGNPILPSITIALIANVVVSLITPAQTITNEEALQILEKERAELDEGTVVVDK